MTPERDVQFSAPTWLRDLGFASWLLVGFVLVIVGVIWLLGQTSTIVMPVILAAVLGAVAGPAVGWLERHRVPRIGGAILVLLGLVAIGVLIFCWSSAASRPSRATSRRSSTRRWTRSRAGSTTSAWTTRSRPGRREEGPARDPDHAAERDLDGISALSSLVFFLAFATLSTLFVLKDGPVMHRFINRHLGVPQPVANVVTTNVAKSLRSYFLGVTIIAAFNAVLIGGAALILGVPLAGTIAVVTFVGAYVPFVGAWVAGAFAVLIALGTEGTTDALIMAVVALLANGALQQIIQPLVMGATLSLNPLVVLVVTIGAGALFGMVGLTLAAPLTSAAVHIANELRERSNELAVAEMPAAHEQAGERSADDDGYAGTPFRVR